MSIDLTIYALLGAVDVLLLALLLAQGVRSRGLRRRHDELQREIEYLQQDIHALCAGAQGVGGHLSRLDRQLKRLSERQDQLEMGDLLHREYDHAVKLVRGGADIEEVMDQCNLVRAEAELLVLLHGPRERCESGPAPGQARNVRIAS